MADPFNLDSLRVDPTDPNLKPRGSGSAKGGGATKTKQEWERRIICFPWPWLRRIKTPRCRATLSLALLLVYEHWRTKGRPIKLTNIMVAELDILPDAKGLALDELERHGLIKVKRRRRKSPLVTVLVDPTSFGKGNNRASAPNRPIKDAQAADI